MKNLIQITTVLFLCIQTTGISQTKDLVPPSKKQEVTIQIDISNLKKFIGTYFLEEADFELEITMENNKMYIVSPFSKDILIAKNETVLREPTRGVDLELIKDDKNALKFSQNGYETIIKRVKSKTKN